MRKHPRKSGFVLLMTLVLLLMAVVSLAGMAHHSMTRAIESRTSVEELQRCWAVTSIRATLLNRVEELLDKTERGRDKNGNLSQTHLNDPKAKLHLSCKLAGLDYELVLTDEQAKLNLNRLLEQQSRSEVLSTVRRLKTHSAAGGNRPVDIKLRTRTTTGGNISAAGYEQPELGGYGQVFQSAPPHRLVGDKNSTGLGANITFWGNGRVNIRRAPAEVVQEACRKILSTRLIKRLLAARDDDPYCGLATMLAGFDEIDEKQRKKIRQRLTDRSDCHGLWIITHGTHRSWYTLTVGVGAPVETGANAKGGDGNPQTIAQWYEFAW